MRRQLNNHGEYVMNAIMKAKELSELERSTGYAIAISFKPFIDPKCSDHMEIVRDMARSINRAYRTEIALIKEVAELGIAVNHSHNKINTMVSRARVLTNKHS
jgi:hypothetical protein